MTYPNMDLQSLPDVIDLRVGTDPVERTLQLSYWQVFAALQGTHWVNANPQLPEKVEQAIDAGTVTEAQFNTAISELETALTTAVAKYEEIWKMVP